MTQKQFETTAIDVCPPFVINEETVPGLDPECLGWIADSMTTVTHVGV